MSMTTDPAWFYSSLAQASAAIVGLIGAILGSRIIDQLQLMRRERAEIAEQLRGHFSVRPLHEPTIQRWQTFRSFLVREIAEHTRAIDRGQLTRTFTAEIGWDFTQGTRSQEVDVLTHQAELQRELVLLDRFLLAYPALTGEIKNLSSSVAQLRDCVRSMPENHPGLRFVLSDLQRLEALDNAILKFRAGLIPRSFPIVFLMLAWISATGVLWPLSALPGFENSYPKPYMLVALGVGLIGLMAYFGYLLFELRRLGRFYWLEG